MPATDKLKYEIYYPSITQSKLVILINNKVNYREELFSSRHTCPKLIKIALEQCFNGHCSNVILLTLTEILLLYFQMFVLSL